MRIAIVSDVHSNIHALEVVLERIEGYAPDAVLCLGDVVGYSAHPNECCRRVRSTVDSSILGNHDRAALTRDVRFMNPYAAAAALWTADRLDEESKSFISSLPTSLRFDDDEGCVVSGFHGSDTDPDEYVYEEMVDGDILVRCAADAVFLGHTHVPYRRAFETGVVGNPGSVGQPRDGDPRASFATFDTRSRDFDVERVEYDTESASESILKAGLPMILASRLAVGK
ncbi:MAG: metallophosphoesterase family protein [Methanobacteriota archaeon]|nr:MAG: metallophosphoesterase family protein [Euryarchaeota archaeon]